MVERLVSRHCATICWKELLKFHTVKLIYGHDVWIGMPYSLLKVENLKEFRFWVLHALRGRDVQHGVIGSMITN